MKIKKLASVIACAGALSLSQTASAAIINPDGVVPVALFGTIQPGVPSSDANEVAYVNFLLSMTTPLPQTVTSGGQTYTTFINLNGSVSLADFNKVDAEDPGFNPVLPLGFEFVLGKYGAGGQGGTGNISVVWWLGGKEFTVPNTVTFDGRTSGGLSHYSTFGEAARVPDGGMTLALLGLSLAGIGYMRRKLA